MVSYIFSKIIANIRGFLGSQKGPLRSSVSQYSLKVGRPVKVLQTYPKLLNFVNLDSTHQELVRFRV